MSDLGIMALKFENTIAIIEINTLEVAQLQSLERKENFSKFKVKNVWLGYFCARVWKWYCHNWNQHSRICFVAKFDTKIKILKFETKNAWWLWAEIWE